MTEKNISMDVPETLYNRLKAEADAMGVTPEITAVFLMARCLREEKREERPDPRMMIIPQLFRPTAPEPPAPAETEADKKEQETKEEKFIAGQQRMFAMNIVSNLLMVAETSGKTVDDIWTKFDEFYLKVQDKMVKDDKIDGILKDIPDKPNENQPPAGAA